MAHIRSSWNSDRVAASCFNKPHAQPKKRVVRMFTEYRGRELKLKTAYGSVRFSARYESDIVAAGLDGTALTVELADGSAFRYEPVNDRYVLTAGRRPEQPEATTSSAVA